MQGRMIPRSVFGHLQRAIMLTGWLGEERVAGPRAALQNEVCVPAMARFESFARKAVPGKACCGAAALAQICAGCGGGCGWCHRAGGGLAAEALNLVALRRTSGGASQFKGPG